MKQATIYLKTLTLLIAVISALAAHALDLNTYASSSVLADGKWVKISVPESGIYKITKAQLSQWGFSDLSKVRIHGYGGQTIPTKLIADNYIDDLPMVQSVAIDDGIVFYALGPGTWKETDSHHRLESNIFTSAGYYFVTDKATAEVPGIETQGIETVASPVTSFIDRLHYEQDLTSPGEAGYVLVGENLKNQNNRTITFSTPGRIDSEPAWFECAIVSKTFTATKAEFSVNGEKLTANNNDKIASITNSVYVHGGHNVTTHYVPQGGEKLEITVSVQNVSITQNTWLDYISLNYPRQLALPSSGYLNFWSSSPELKLDAGNAQDVVVWDVTDPTAITCLKTNNSGQITWGNEYTGNRTYAAWAKKAALPQPTYIGTVSNQNLHGSEGAEMIIITLPEYKTQAERVAELHRKSANPITTMVITTDEVYNEFSSGMAEVSGIRKCLKMFYDRSKSSDKPLKYALLVGRSTYDNRHLTSQFSSAGAYNTIPYWMGGITSGQFSDNTAYGTDDLIAMLEDGSGSNMGLDDLSIAVGRLPVTSASEAKSYIDKLYKYVNESASGTWKNSFLFLADDGDSGVHASQTEKMIELLEQTPSQQNFITKVYVDAYDIIGGVCEGGRQEMYRLLDEGVVWWNFSGHANNHSWTGESMLTFTDINNMYLKKIPIVMAATCDFLRWDSNTISGGEIMFHESNGGAIAMISATRPVYISDNGLFTRAIAKAISKRDSDGALPRLGDIYRTAKNNILNDNGEHKSNPNRLRYVLMGDPAMMLPTPSNIVKIESIGGEELTSDNQVTIMALQQTEIKGSICRPNGEVISDFDGTVTINIYDAEKSMNTQGERDENVKIIFQQHGDKLYAGSAKVVGGKFTLNLSMPGEVADNFRPALINAYACSTDKNTEAVGINKDFYVYGLDESVAPDNEPPVIETMVLNHSSFKPGDAVNESPMVIATISDNVGINLSVAGVGHQMVVTLDGKRTFTDVSQFFVPSADGSPSGEIRYPMSDLSAGDHTLSLKVWDTASNSATKQIDFVVEKGTTPTIFDVYTDVNPASTEVKFFIRHNRPDAELTATITVYDLLGHPLWETVEKGQADMFVSAPVVWDLIDSSGRRLPRGIYLYRATLSTDNGDTYDSAARRLAVTAQ